MPAVKSWEGAIVRSGGPRKGKVIADGISRETREHRALVHWDDDTLDDLPVARLTMLAPPVVPAVDLEEPEEHGESIHDALGRLWWPGVAVVLGTLAVCAALISWWTR